MTRIGNGAVDAKIWQARNLQCCFSHEYRVLQWLVNERLYYFLDLYNANFSIPVAVVVAFFICWAPFYAQRLMTVYIKDDQWTETLLEIQSSLFYTSGWYCCT